MPIYRKTGRKDTWRIQIYHKGSQREWLVHGSHKDAEAFEARKRVELEQRGDQEVRVVPTFSNFCLDHYRAHAETHLKSRTWSNRKYKLRTLADAFGDKKLTDITLAVLEEFKNSRVREGVRPATINDELKVFRAVRSYAKALGVPIADVKVKDIPMRGKRKVVFWTEEEVDRLLAKVAEMAPNIYPMVLFLLNTGCRKGEALALEWSCVDLNRGLFLIEPNEEWQPKNNQAREIPIAAPLLPFLKSSKSKRWVFPSREGERYVVWPQLTFDRARKSVVPEAQKVVHANRHGEGPIYDCEECQRFALKGGPHTARHTFASHFLKGCPDLFLLARILGHSDITVTKLYSHLLPDHLQRARDVVAFRSAVGSAELEARMKWGDQ